jgi:hypothetical protein
MVMQHEAMGKDLQTNLGEYGKVTGTIQPTVLNFQFPHRYIFWQRVSFSILFSEILLYWGACFSLQCILIRSLFRRRA